jgi:hypothetical protein
MEGSNHNKRRRTEDGAMPGVGGLEGMVIELGGGHDPEQLTVRFFPSFAVDTHIAANPPVTPCFS